MTIICPCCKHPMNAGETPEFLKYISHGTVSQKILTALVNAYPNGLTKSRLVFAAYADDVDGGPDCANESINVIIFHLRKSLKKHGWKIPPVKRGRPDDTYIYRLERCDG